MSKKLVEKFVDTLSAHVCDAMTEDCEEYFLNKYGLKVEDINDENVRYLCKGFSDENFDTLVDECRYDCCSCEHIMTDMIVNECHCIANDEDYYWVDFIKYESLNVYNYFTDKEIKKLKKIITEDEDYFLVNEIFDKCHSKIGTAIALSDIIRCVAD